MMHGREKSDSAIVAGKPTNKAVPTAAEPVEPRAGAKGRSQGQEPRAGAKGRSQGQEPRAGAKGRGQGERAPAKHATDSVPKTRVTSAGACTANCKAKEEGEVHCAPPPHQHRLPADGVLRAQTRCRLRRGRTDVADLRSRP